MATYSNPHWLLCHIRNSFISTDDTGICEMVMLSDDLPKHYLKQYDGSTTKSYIQYKHQNQTYPHFKNLDIILQEGDFMCYPGLDQSDDEDLDLSTQSLDIQMYPETGAHRFRSNTAQKLEKMDIARRKAARIKCVSYDEEVMMLDCSDMFIRKAVNMQQKKKEEEYDNGVRSKLTIQLANSPKQAPNKFQDYAHFDGSSQNSIPTKRINVFLNMLPGSDRNYPIKICAIATAKISEVIGLICFKATLQFPQLSLKSIDHYGLYMTEDKDDLVDFPPLDSSEVCSKFGFSQLTLAERQSVFSLHSDGEQTCNVPGKSTMGEEKDQLPHKFIQENKNSKIITNDLSVKDVHYIKAESDLQSYVDDLEQLIMSQDDMLEAPIYRSYNLNIIDKRFFRNEVTLSICGDRIEMCQQKHNKFWAKQKAVSYPIDAVANCEIVEKRTLKAVLRIWVRIISITDINNSDIGRSNSSASCHQLPFKSSFNILNATTWSHFPQQQMRFKHYDYETTIPIAEHINKKLNCILEMHTSDTRREFLFLRTRKLQKKSFKKIT